MAERTRTLTRVLFLAMVVATLHGGLAMPSQADYQIWFENSTVKVFQDTAPGDATGVRLTAAQNEQESFQVVIRAGTEPLRNVTVQVSDLVQENGARLNADRVALYRVAYVHLPAHGRDYPDALPPFSPCAIPKAQNQPVWIDFSVPAEAVPGTYRGTVTVQAEGQAAQTGLVELTVWRFALPETPHSRTAFGLNEEAIAAFHSVAPGSAEHQALKRKYYEMLVAHRAMPYSLPVPVESAEAARYLDNPRVTAFCVPYVDDEAALRKLAAYLREKDWLKKAYFYVVDEPITKEHYDLLRERAARVHAADPGLKVAVPYFREPTFAAEGGAAGLLTGVCDIWCPKVHFYQEDFLTARQQLGEEVWWYVCWEPGAPYANLYVDMAGVDHRALFWQQAHYRVQGFLYWGTTHWNPQSGTADPWTDMATVKDLSPTVYGDGSLLYPGAKVGVDGPVGSIRLKLIRAGLEDVEYLRLLEAREGWDAVRAVTGTIVQGLDAYSRDVNLLLAQREAVGRRLSEGRPGCQRAYARDGNTWSTEITPMTRDLILPSLLLVNAISLAAEPIAVGSRRELFVDDALIERLAGTADLRLHSPTPQNVALVADAPWEGNGTNYVTVFQDDGKYRMYYRGSHYSYLDGQDRPNSRDLYCYAESLDGIHWTKPELGLFAWNSSKQNNIVWDGVGAHAFVPFRDTNPNCAPDATYKALGVGGGEHGLYAFQSTDGIHWKLMQAEPVVTQGAFDSHNLAFWDAQRGEYREYHRDFRGGRDIRTSTSQDFLHWTEPEFLTYAAHVDPGRGEGHPADVKDPVGAQYPAGRVSELYTNQIAPYYRAPHLLLGFPTRYIDRGWTESAKALPRYDYRQVRAKGSPREGTAVTDGMFITSRDRKLFSVWPESFIRPGLRTRDSWFYGDTYQNWGLVETRSAIEDAPTELSLYVTERTGRETGAVLRRYTLRIDGFVSLHAPLAGGELLTRPITFAGNQLSLNVSTSAAGSVRIEIQNIEGQAIPGFALADCHDVYGDDLERPVAWKGNPDLGALAGQSVRLRFEVKDADLYSFRFQRISDAPRAKTSLPVLRRCWTTLRTGGLSQVRATDLLRRPKHDLRHGQDLGGDQSLDPVHDPVSLQFGSAGEGEPIGSGGLQGGEAGVPGLS